MEISSFKCTLYYALIVVNIAHYVYVNENNENITHYSDPGQRVNCVQLYLNGLKSELNSLNSIIITIIIVVVTLCFVGN